MHCGKKYGILSWIWAILTWWSSTCDTNYQNHRHHVMMMTKIILMVITMLMMMKKVAACPSSSDLYGSLRPAGLLYKAKAKADLYDKCPNWINFVTPAFMSNWQMPKLNTAAVCHTSNMLWIELQVISICQKSPLKIYSIFLQTACKSFQIICDWTFDVSKDKVKNEKKLRGSNGQ